MRYWFYRLQNSRRLRHMTFGAIAVVSLGSCAGAIMANYTVAGMNTLPYTGGQQHMAQSDRREAEPEWMRDAAMAATGDTDKSTGFSSSATADYSDASY